MFTETQMQLIASAIKELSDVLEFEDAILSADFIINENNGSTMIEFFIVEHGWRKMSIGIFPLSTTGNKITEKLVKMGGYL